MNVMIKYKIFFLLIVFQLQIQAQNVDKCYTTPIVERELEINHEYAEARENHLKESKKWLSNNLNLTESKEVITIPIVVHVVHRNSHPQPGQGTNIPDSQIEDQIRILNEDYSKTNPEFPNPPRNTFVNIAGNPNLKFCLASVDPNGNPTNGITRTATTKTNFDPDTEGNDMKRNSTNGKDGWDPSRYLNIWVCDLASSQGGGMVLGYAYLPGLLAGFGFQAWKDGLVVDFQWFGTTDLAAGSSDGRTATHEIGHYLGLNHTFCESQSGGCCDNDDANVDDTPATDGVYWGPVFSFTSNNSCNDLFYGFSSDYLDMDENYMSYAANTWMFSQGQVNAMIATLNTPDLTGGRLNLKNSNVAVNCGTVNTEWFNKNNPIDIYPNPSSGYINISSHEIIESISIIDFFGKIVLVDENYDGNQINIKELKNGIYLAKISTLQNTYTKKIIINQ